MKNRRRASHTGAAAVATATEPRKGDIER